MADNILTYLTQRANGENPKAPRIVFTKRRLEDLPTDPKAYTVHDEKVTGLRCNVSAKGTKSLVVVRKPKGGTAPVTVTICKLGDLHLDEIRNRAQEAISLLTRGINPNTKRRAQAAADKTTGLTLADAYAQYTKAKNLAPRTLAGYARAVDRDLADWKSKPLKTISRSMVLDRFAKIEAEIGKGPAVRSMQVLRAVWLHANSMSDDDSVPYGICPVVVLSRVDKRWASPGVRRTKVSADDLPAWLSAVRDLPNGPGEGHRMASFLEFVLLTGVRRREAGFLKWVDVDLAKRTMVFRETKNHSDHTLPISDRVLEILRSMGKGGTVFGDLDPRNALGRVAKASGVSVTVHDLRRSFASFADRSGAGGYATKAILNHSTSGDVTGQHYSQYDTDDLREPLQAIEDYILKTAKAHDARVLQVVK